MRAIALAPSVVIALGLAAVLSCSGSTQPRLIGASHLSATYVLVRIAGDALPTNEYVTPGFPSTVLADTLRFNRDGSGASVSVVRVEPPATGAPRVERYEGTFQYEIEGGRVVISFDCPSLGICVVPPHMIGQLTEGGIRFDFVINARVPQDYATIATLEAL